TNTILNQVKNGDSKNPDSVQLSQPAKNKAFRLPSFRIGFLKKNKSEAGTNSKKKKRTLFIVAGVILVPVVLILIAGLATYFPAKSLKTKIQEAEVLGRQAYDALKGQDLLLANQKLDESKAKLDEIKQDFNKLSWYKFTPFRAYYLDGERLIASAEAGINAGTIL